MITARNTGLVDCPETGGGGLSHHEYVLTKRDVPGRIRPHEFPTGNSEQTERIERPCQVRKQSIG